MNLFELAMLLVLGSGAVALVLFWQRARIRHRSRERLQADQPRSDTGPRGGLAPPLPPGPDTSAGQPEAEPARPPTPGRPFVRRFYWVAILVGILVGVSLYFFTDLGLVFSLTLGAIVALLGTRVEAWRQEQRRLLIQTQLADALDLMISTLQAGASVFSALESVLREARSPLRGQLEEVLGRIRYGDNPQTVLRALERRVPLETFRLFTAALAVHWEVGGSLTPVLASVGRSIRDRIELARRVRSMTAQSRASIVAVTLVTYFIALIVWRNDPGRMEAFLNTEVGRGLVSVALLLQAAGIVWSGVLTRMKY